jgi:hypothetical protein
MDEVEKLSNFYCYHRQNPLEYAGKFYSYIYFSPNST